MLYHAQVFGIKNISPSFVFIDGQIFSGSFFLHDRILPTARMRARALICIPSRKITAQQTAPRIGNAHRPMNKAFDFQFFRNPRSDFLNLPQGQFSGGNNPFGALPVPETVSHIICIIGLRGNMNIDFRAYFLRQHKHSRVSNNQRVRLHFFQFSEIRGRAFHIIVMRKNIRRHMYAHVMRVCKSNSFRHLFFRKIFRFRTQSESLSSNIHRIRAEYYRRFQYFQAARRNQ